MCRFFLYVLKFSRFIAQPRILQTSYVFYSQFVCFLMCGEKNDTFVVHLYNLTEDL